MNLPPLDVARLLRSHGLAPRKSLGQNFLTDPAALQRIVEAAEIEPSSIVLEIGAGLGSLTRCLAAVCRQVIAVELDGTLIPLLKMVLAPYPNVQIIQGDILEIPPGDLIKADDYLVVANIPYYITSALIRHLLEAQHKPCRLVLTVQREVAQRICAMPGDLSLLALSVQVYGHAYPVARIPAGAFYPPPKVDSTTLRVDIYHQPRVPPDRLDVFFTLARAGFSQKRKTLRNSLSAGLRLSPVQVEELLSAARIQPVRRAETLSIEEWLALVDQTIQSGVLTNR